MNKKYCYEYPRASITADCVVFRYEDDKLQVLLIERGNEPYKGNWAIPGGFLDMDETIEECATRELKEETGLDVANFSQVRAFTAVNRDPRGRTVSIALWAVVRYADCVPTAGDDAAKAQWFSIDNLPKLAFDHSEILIYCIEAMKRCNL